jgi:hypothetical protein
MANGNVDGGAPSDLSAGGGRISERSAGCGVGAAGAADPRADCPWEGSLSVERVERRLAPILGSDIAGYSHLMGADEAGRHAAPREAQLRVVSPGRIATLS